MLFTFCLFFQIQASYSIKKLDDSFQPFFIKYTVPSQNEFTLEPGRYKVTCYGAQGGMSNSGNPGGRGALVIGYMNITQHKQKLYAFVGGQGIRSTYGSAAGGFNGGGQSGFCKKYSHHMKSKHKPFGPGSGGGATDLRIDTTNINDRIIVAAGGSGAGHSYQGAPGGDLNGYNSNGPSPNTNQINGNSDGQGSTGGIARRYPSSGGGGGYKGGISGISSNSNTPSVVSDSGSSYISGYPSCSNHPKMQFDLGQMIAGIKEGDGSIEIEEVYRCSENCLDCVSSDKCRKCDPSYRLFEGRCYSECPVGSIDRNLYCEKCDSSCQSCSEVSTNCSSCYKDDFYYQGQCLSKCPSGTLEFGKECKDECPIGTYAKGEICDECELPCIECVGNPTKCTECAEGTYLFNNKCIEKCPERTVRDGNKCLTECESDQFLYNGFCYSQCPKGTYAKGVICENCDSSCVECQNDEKTCISCNDITYLHNSKCIDKCPEDFYSYNNRCVANCPNESFILGKNCVDICPKGKFGVNHVCKDCDLSCESCENASMLCTKCSKDSFLFNNKCISECINGTFIYQNECLYKCPPGSHSSGNICQDKMEYYNVEKVLKKIPVISSVSAAIIISILVFIFVGVLIALILILRHKFSNHDRFRN